MKFKEIVREVLFKINSERLAINGGKIKVLSTLLVLFIRSKFAESGSRIISHRLAGFRVHAFDYPTLAALYIDIFLFGIYDFTTSNLPPLIVDCGSHIGVSVLYFKSIHPGSTIMAFEPNPEVFSLLRRNVEENGLANVQLYNFALSNVSGPRIFQVPVKKGSINGSFLQGYKASVGTSVETVKLSSFIDGKIIDFIKIDTEGEEEKIIQNLSDAGQLGSIKEFVIEYHHQINDSDGRFGIFLCYFEKAGFIYTLIGVDHFGASRQNILIRFKRRNNS